MNISAIIPVYNAEKYLEKAVHSALQFDVVKEVILVEDASPDNALAICKALAAQETRVKLYQHPNLENKGAGASRNLGMEKATMEYIAFLDADDYFLPNRFDREIKHWNSKGGFEGMYSAIGVHFYTEVSRENFCEKFNIPPTAADQYLTTMKSGVAPQDLFLALNNVAGHQAEGYFSLDGLTLNRKKLVMHQLKFEESLRLHQDTVFIYQCAYYLLLRDGNVQQAVSIRGVHDENRITGSNPKKTYHTRFLMYQAFYDWAEQENITPVLLRYYYQKHYFQMRKGNLINKWVVYIKLIFGEKQFFKVKEARSIHYDLFQNNYLQKLYNAFYVRINRKLAN